MTFNAIRYKQNLIQAQILCHEVHQAYSQKKKHYSKYFTQKLN